MVYLISGGKNKGKTARLREMFRNAAGAAGFASVKVISGDKRTGFDIENLVTGERHTLARLKNLPAPEGLSAIGSHGAFVFYREGFEAADRIIGEAVDAGAKALFLDELGKLELQGEGLHGTIRRALDSGRDVYVTVRDINVEQAAAAFGMTGYEVVDIGS